MNLRTELRLVIERLVRRFLGRMVGQMAFGLLLVVLTPVVVILAVAIFAVLAVAIFGLYAVLGQPEALAPVVGMGWLLGSLLVVFLVLVRSHRWLSRLMAVADAPALAIDPYDDQPESLDPRPSPFVSPSPAFEERLAAADVRHAPDLSGKSRGPRTPE